MGYGLVTDDRSREEGRHYTDQCGARLHARGASDETRVLQDQKIAAFGSSYRYTSFMQELPKAAILAVSNT
ncbi:hypothetical protein DBR18_02495 [Pseudomonas sp. HMWF021]|nr:hypothetical protein DBR18_02495 [Pseudomonas sp. HMWF021]